MNREAEEFRISSYIKQANLEIVQARLEQAEHCIREVAASLAWNCFGECRAVQDGPIMPAHGALEMARDFLASQQEEEKHSCKNCLGVDTESCMFKHPEQPEGFTHFPELLESVQQMDAMLKAEGAQGEREVGWRCFHCNEHFTNEEQAAQHFGTTMFQHPACQIDVAEYRAMEQRMHRYNDEDADIHRAMYRMQTEHQQALRREEEKGYARGLKDAAALAQPSPASRQAVEGMADALRHVIKNCDHETLEDIDYGQVYSALKAYEQFGAQPSPAPELERPEVLYGPCTHICWTPDRTPPAERKRVVLVEAAALDAFAAKHDRIVGALRCQISALALGAEQAMEQRDAAQARVAELEKQEPEFWYRDDGDGGVEFTSPCDGFARPLYADPVAQAGQLHELDKQCRADVARALGLTPHGDGYAWSALLADIKTAAKVAQAGQVPDVRSIARFLSDRNADSFGMDREEQWNLFGHEYIEDVEARLAAAPAQGGSTHE